jgi:hypothetical protein
MLMQHLRHLGAIVNLVIGLSACSGFYGERAGIPETAGMNGAVSSIQHADDRQYLYVDRQTLYHHQLLERYLLRDGIPNKSPDFTIHFGASFGYAAQIAVAGDGTLFVMSESSGPIFAFARNSREPERSIIIPQSGPCVSSPSRAFFTTSLAVDQRGYVFVQFVTYGTDGKPVPSQDLPQHRAICDGVWVFASGANGAATPVATIPLPEVTYATALSVDPSDNLYMALNQSHVLEFADATTRPVRTRVFHGPSHVMQLVTTDETSNVFIVTTKGLYGSEHINRFTATGEPHDGPASSIDVDTSNPHIAVSMAALARHLYIVNDDETGIELYHAYQSGPQKPFDFVKAKNVASIAIGP